MIDIRMIDIRIIGTQDDISRAEAALRDRSVVHLGDVNNILFFYNSRTNSYLGYNIAYELNNRIQNAIRDVVPDVHDPGIDGSIPFRERLEADLLSNIHRHYSMNDILELLAAGPLTTKEIAKRLGAHPRGVFILLCDAKEAGFIETVWLDRYTSAWRAVA